MFFVRRLTDIGLLTLQIDASLSEAVRWAVHLRSRWGELTWIERPHAEAITPETEERIAIRCARRGASL